MVVGTILSYDASSGTGELMLKGGVTRTYSVMAFLSGRPPRLPRPGETVSVVTNRESIVTIRPAP